MSEFRPVERASLADGLAEQIVRLIRSGTYQPGDRLPAITEMARSFGVGHPTLREALKQLEVVGVIEIKHGSGVYVLEGHDVFMVSNPVFGGVASKKMLLDLIEARGLIETRSASLAATNATREQLARLESILEKAEENLDDDTALNTANLGFHREIAVASGNTVLTQLLNVLTNLFRREQGIILNIYGSRRKDHKEHLEILNALRERDAALAESRMRSHLDGVRDVLLRWDPEKTPLH